MLARFLCLSAVILSFCLLAACGRSSSSLVEQSALTEALEQSADLPALTDLPATERSLSMVGPGWYPLPADAYIHAQGEAPGPPPDELPLDAVGGTAFALYGVTGFDGDNGPTSARITVAAVTGQYYVAFSDYIAGNWQHAGPFDASATAEIPGTDEYTSPTAFTSHNGTCYFAVIVPTGGSLTITGVELGVHGGAEGPLPCGSLMPQDGEKCVSLRWLHSPDYRDPDFAGYLVQRAPLLSGHFAPIGPPQPVPGNYFIDETGVLDQQYRYRVAAADVSGNISIWRSGIGGRVTGQEVSPVAVLRMPPGPLYGPVDVTFDLSQSFDPENPGIPSPSIDNYIIQSLYAPLNYTGAAPTATLTLQPGCYYILAAAEVTADARAGVTYETLVVYPRWRPNPVVVREPDPYPDGARLLLSHAIRNPATGRVTLFGYDKAACHFAIWHENAAGSFELHTLPAYSEFLGGNPIWYIGKPVVFQDTILAPVAMAERFAIARFDGNHAEWQMLGNLTGPDEIALVTDGTDNVWAIFAVQNGLLFELAIANLTTDAVTHTIIPDTGDDLDAIDAVYNPDNGMIEIVYGWFDSGGPTDYVEYVRWDPASSAVDGITAPHLAIDYARSIDLEINPSTNRPGLVYCSWSDNWNRYRELEADLSTWSVEELIDNSNLNGPASFEYAGVDNNPFACFGLGPVLARNCVLYEKVANVWSLRNTASWSVDSGYLSHLMSIDGSDEFVVVDNAGTRDVYVATMHANGTDTVWPWPIFGTDYLPATEGQGFELHGTGGTDGVHVVWRDWSSTHGRHYISPDGGTTWNDAGDLPGWPISLDLTSDSNGEVYCSYVDSITLHAHMDYWDGLALANRLDILSHIQHRPFFSALPLSEAIQWGMWENGASIMHFIEGNEIGGYADNPVFMTDGPIWTGTILADNVLSGIGDPKCWAMGDGANPDEANLGILGWGTDQMDQLYNPLPPAPLDFLNAPECWGRTLAVSVYTDKSMITQTGVYWATHDNLYTPIRLEYNLAWGLSVTDLPFDPYGQIEPYAVEGRRTVSADLAWGLTAVGLLCDFNGGNAYFEWSRFGDWETLPLPDGVEHWSSPELVVGTDGRWHIIYKNILTDQVMSISTL